MVVVFYCVFSEHPDSVSALRYRQKQLPAAMHYGLVTNEDILKYWNIVHSDTGEEHRLVSSFFFSSLHIVVVAAL